jgi:hypothetical protein
MFKISLKINLKVNLKEENHQAKESKDRDPLREKR